jgi:hypothetical protein
MTARAYKKHMKHATNLFWIPRSGDDPMKHWQFDSSHHLIAHQDFQSEAPEQTIEQYFSGISSHGSENGPTTDSDVTEAIPRESVRRTFLALPDGFYRDLYRAETIPPVISPVGCF